MYAGKGIGFKKYFYLFEDTISINALDQFFQDVHKVLY